MDAAAASSASANDVAAAARAKATDAYKAGNYDKAIALYSEALSAAPEAKLYLNRAAAHLMLAAYAPALSDCKKAVALDAADIKAYVRGAKAALALGDMDEARNLATQATLRDPRDDDARKERARITDAMRDLASARTALETREWDKALTVLNRLCDKTCPGAYALKLLRIEAQLGVRSYEAANTASSALLKDSGGGGHDPKLLVLRARILAAQGNTTGAVKHAQVGCMDSVGSNVSSRPQSVGRAMCRTQPVDIRRLARRPLNTQEALRVDPDNVAAAKLLRAWRKSEALVRTD